MSLEDWRKNNWLHVHATSENEIAELLAIAERDIGQAQTPGLLPDWRLPIAYNAALQLATAALAAAGYRCGTELKHVRTIESLRFTLGTDAGLIRQLDTFRSKRNVSDYERAGAISDADADAMLALAKRLRKDVRTWLSQKHPELMP